MFTGNPETMKALVSAAAAVRQFESPADGVVLQAIGLGFSTRRELKDVLGFGYDVIEKCLERNSAEIRTRQQGSIDRFELASAPVGAAKVQYVCVDCGGPRSAGSAQRCGACYDKRVAATAQPVQEVEVVENIPDDVVSRTCGCGRSASHVGRCGYRRAQAAARKANAAVPVLKQEPIVVPAAEPVVKRGALVSAQRTTSTEVYGGVRLHERIDVTVAEMATWPKERITEFFAALAKVVEIPTRPTRTEIIPAWPVDFEDQSVDGMPGLTMCYLMSLLHDSMDETEKQAVWTLVLYIKRVQAAVEVAKR